ncbi:hypothetical protein [Salinihabitans flavidus]|uniref:hypothetical protein n=1 Tax=Salinihabitans flavidus TaxID=569882 RepID=UPI001113D00D|nr:hypothetical protein [Salinihabitans flavidus]
MNQKLSGKPGAVQNGSCPMTKKPKKESQKEQSARFEKAVQDMIDARELNPTEAEEAFERAMSGVARSLESPPDE